MFIRIENFVKRFDGKTVINNLSLSIKRGEFHVILGPSGEGKSVLLNLISGVLKPDSGEIYIDNHNVTKSLPENRPISMVFQDYALFPHLSVRDNIAFGMKTQRKSRAYINEKVDEFLKIMRLNDKANEKPHALSGGQKQRVAIARALAAEPEIILFDEALSHLDINLQGQLIDELKELHHKTRTTILYVTHSRNEALELADRITLMHNGTIEQTGTVEELFNHPKTEFSASFMGKKHCDKEVWVYVKCEKDTEKKKFPQRRLIGEKVI